MTMKRWAVKPGELRALARTSRLVWAARCAMRTEEWRPPGVDALWDDGLRLLVEAAAAAPGAIEVATVARALGDRGALASNRRDGTDAEALGRCMNYATLTVRCALEATALPDGPALAKAVIDVAKYAASIPALLAHAGLTRAPPGAAAVDVAAVAVWGAIRADLAPCAATAPGVSLADVRALAPLWPPGARAWIAP
ncbi:MAG: hypothetical protein IPL61_04435 [Myxococcales bacterium]|nr:hypothetical protein [Myxococcales bacterium]